MVITQIEIFNVWTITKLSLSNFHRIYVEKEPYSFEQMINVTNQELPNSNTNPNNSVKVGLFLRDSRLDAWQECSKWTNEA